MARKGDYSNPNKYSDKKSFDGSPVEPGKVLVPFVKDFADLPKKLCVDENFTSPRFGGIPVTVGFMQVDKDKFAANMKAFWKDVNEFLSEKRAGRCIIGYDACGEMILCPNTRRCTGCPEKDLHERFNPNCIEITTLDQDYEGEGFEGIPDESQPSVEDQAIENIEPSLTEDEHYEILIARLKKDNPRFAEIVRLSKASVPVDDIIEAISLKSSRGHEEINNAYNMCCDLLGLGHMKIKDKRDKKKK